MKIVIATDSYKGSISTVDAARAIEKGIIKVFPQAEIIKMPVADGGEGTVNALVLGTNGEFRQAEVISPIGDKILAQYGILQDNTAVIEMASASGLQLIPEEMRNPLYTTTYGTGQLIKAALDEGCKKILIGIGGSATNDGGAGMAQALGVSFTDSTGKELGFGGGELAKLARIDLTCLDPRLSQTEIIVASDVTNPLCGERGASFVYGPQKGATQESIEYLDRSLYHYATIIKEQLGKDINDIPGAGAAGGLGAGLIVFCNGVLRSGIEIILDLLNIDQHLLDADLVITGEGQIDEQTINGKVPIGVARRAKKYGVPVLAITGSIGEKTEEIHEKGIDAMVSIINQPMELKYAMENAAALITQASERAMRLLNIGRMLTGAPYTLERESIVNVLEERFKNMHS
ncbi:MAG: glycerate kinase [Firmicutes bacterium]|nr:glycerate kinase [Bacillota bacterium]